MRYPAPISIFRNWEVVWWFEGDPRPPRATEETLDYILRNLHWMLWV